MDKWKDLELEKMKVGGNRRAKEFLASQPDYNASTMSLQQRYNSRAAALYRDKISTQAQGKTWSADSSPAQNHSSPYVSSSSSTVSEKQSKVSTRLVINEAQLSSWIFISRPHQPNEHSIEHQSSVVKTMVAIKTVAQVNNNTHPVLAVVIPSIGALVIQTMTLQANVNHRIQIY